MFPVLVYMICVAGAARGTPGLAYDSRSLAFALHGGSQQDIDIYVMINTYWEELTFQIQGGATNAWRRVVDTSHENPFDFLEPGNENLLQSLHYRVPGRAVVLTSISNTRSK